MPETQYDKNTRGGWVGVNLILIRTKKFPFQQTLQTLNKHLVNFPFSDTVSILTV